MNRSFRELLGRKWDEGKFLCVGLDPDLDKIPATVPGEKAGEKILAFNRAIVDATKDIVCTYKPNPAFYEAFGPEGWEALQATIAHIHSVAPDVPVLLDAKRGDIGNTNDAYAKMAFDICGADAVTVQPYQGGDALAPFLARADKGVFVLVRTSNPGAGELQDLSVNGEELYKVVARAVAGTWNANGNCAVVVGTTYPAEIAAVRALIGDMPILMPGIGAQGGDLDASVKAGKNSRNQGIIINASRAVLYASNGTDFAEVARTKAQEFDDLIRKSL